MILSHLPPEILREIFMLCLPTNATRKLQETDAPVNLTRVCSTWYYIAIEAPKLWSTIVLLSSDPETGASDFVIDTSDCASDASDSAGDVTDAYATVDRGTDYLRLCLSRTKQVPLHLYLPVAFIAYPLSYSLICSHSHRISTLSIFYLATFSGKCFSPPYFPQHSFPTPNLTSFEAFVAKEAFLLEDDFQSLRYIVQSASDLKKFGFYHCGPLGFGTIPTNWSTFQELRLNSSTPIELCCHILRNATSLRKASFGWVYNDPMRHETPRELVAGIPPVDLSVPYTHPALETLLIAHRDLRTLETILRAFTLPRLQNILLQYIDDEDDSWPQAAFLDFLQRSRCSLRQLGLDTEPLSPAQLIEVLESQAVNNSLIGLLVWNGFTLSLFDDVVVERLTCNPSEGSPRLCPQLQMMHLPRIASALIVENLITMLESRLDPNFQLFPTFDVPIPRSTKSHAYLKYLKIYDEDEDFMLQHGSSLASRGLLIIVHGPEEDQFVLDDQDKVLLRRYTSEGLLIWDYNMTDAEWGPDYKILDHLSSTRE